MSRGNAKKRASSKGRKGSGDWGSLSWDDLDDWAGPRSVSRGRSYQRQGRVKNLAIAEDGRLLATVQGGDEITGLDPVAGRDVDGEQLAAGLKGQGQGRLHRLDDAVGQDRDAGAHR